MWHKDGGVLWDGRSALRPLCVITVKHLVAAYAVSPLGVMRVAGDLKPRDEYYRHKSRFSSINSKRDRHFYDA